MASTCLNEQGWHPDLIELQLAPAERNKVRAAYSRATRLAERRAIVQAWADYLGMLRIETAPDYHQYRHSANKSVCQDGILDNRLQPSPQA